MVVDCYATESVVSMVAGLIDQGYEDYAVEAAISKVFATEALWRISDEALQIAGGNGYMREFPYEQAMRDCRINRIFEGTNEILRLFIALTAMNDVGQQLKELAGVREERLRRPHQGLRRPLRATPASGPRWPPAWWARGAASPCSHPALKKAADRGRGGHPRPGAGRRPDPPQARQEDHRQAVRHPTGWPTSSSTSSCSPACSRG